MSIFRQFVCGQQSDNKPEEPVRWPGLTRGAKKWWAANAWNFSCLEVWANHSENKKYNQRLLGKVPLSNILYQVLILEWGFTMKPRESGCGRNQFFSKVSKHTFFAKLVSQPKLLFALRQSFLSRTKPDHNHRSIKLMRFTRINYRGPERTMGEDVRTFGVLLPRGSSGQWLRKRWSMVPELDIIQGCSKLCNICR